MDNFYLKCGHLWRRVQFGVYSLWTVGDLCPAVGENVSIILDLVSTLQILDWKLTGLEHVRDVIYGNANERHALGLPFNTSRGYNKVDIIE